MNDTRSTHPNWLALAAGLVFSVGATLIGAEVGVAAETDGPASPETIPTAANADRAVSFELGTGLEYDSNVAVLELDTSSNAGDAAALLDFGVSYDKPQTGRFRFRAGYNFSETLHEDFDDFDVSIHRASATLTHDLDRVDWGATLQHAHAELDGNEFLVLQQASPFVSTLVGARLFVRFAMIHSDKDFATNPSRDAASDSVSADAYVFINGLKTYLVFGYRHDDENALDEQFDYAGQRLRMQLSRRFALQSRELTLKIALRYETRDYDAPTLSIGERRDDDRYQLETSVDIPLGERVLATFGYKYADNRSNLQSVNFDENVFSLSFRASL